MACGFFSMFTLTSLFIFGTAVFIMITAIRRFSKTAFGNPDITKVIEQEDMADTSPKSLRGMDQVYLPLIMADFPSFNPTLAKTNVRNKLREMLKDKAEFKIHNVVISNYLRGSVEKTIYFQASLQYRESGRLTQKRYDLHYAYLLPQGEGSTISANCPNCGGVISSSSQKVCEFCDSLLVNVMGNSWEFTDDFES